MNKYEIENCVLACIINKPSLINELYVDCFRSRYNKTVVKYLKNFYEQYKHLDMALLIENFPDKLSFSTWYSEMLDMVAIPSRYYEYQQEMINIHKNDLLLNEITKFSKGEIKNDELIENINKINEDSMIISKGNKRKPDEMLSMIRNEGKLIRFNRFYNLNSKMRMKNRTVNVIGARPSEGKSALALNLFCDLARNHKCLYFNMEMTEEEVYERMLAIESNIDIKEVVKPLSEEQDKKISTWAEKIYNYKYEVINGSKTTRAIKNKVIREQKDEHVYVFIDYVGYIVGKAGQSDRERIGEAVRELNNITKDYDCTIFLIAQINRNGAETPTMEDLKDSGEVEQTADSIILIHDPNKENNEDVKQIYFCVPKCRGGKRNTKISVRFDKPKARMEVE